MTDIRIAWTDPAGALHADFETVAGDLALDDTLETAVMVSLFTDRRAPADYPLPTGIDDRRGWWADAYADRPGDQAGSLLWLLQFEKWGEAARQNAERWARESLRWLLDDGIASAVEVVATLPRWTLVGLEIAIAERAGGRKTCAFVLSAGASR
jgi:phage gp46-like protein